MIRNKGVFLGGLPFAHAIRQACRAIVRRARLRGDAVRYARRLLRNGRMSHTDLAL